MLNFNSRNLFPVRTKINSRTRLYNAATSAMITNPTLVESCSVSMSSISDHNLVEVTLRVNRPKAKAKYVTTRSYSGYAPDSFCEDLSLVPWHMVTSLMTLIPKWKHSILSSWTFCISTRPSNIQRSSPALIRL